MKISDFSNETVDFEEELLEVRAVRKKSIRGGKVIKRRDCPPGYKLVGGKRCVRMGSKERLTRRRAGIRAGRKGKAARKRSFKRSTRLRQRRRLKRVNF